ncbi:hypothetical protein [Listeria goaensis]|uniref:hypothetical protein n=1 Tax=Listeria goaensis TaxID=1649188 RepID=UPI000B5980C4|nr:hypothetical protein [Listeria goaensis]
MDSMKNKPDLTQLSPFQAIQTARANHMPLPPELNMQLRQAREEEQLYYLKKRMFQYYPSVLQDYERQVKLDVERCFNEWQDEIEQCTKEVSENSKGKASEQLGLEGKNIVQKPHLRNDVEKAHESVAFNEEIVLQVPSHPLLPLI